MLKWRLTAGLLCVAAVAALLSMREQGIQPEAMQSVSLRIALWDYEKNAYDQRIIEAFERDNPDIAIDVVSFPAEYYINNLLSMLDGAEAMDVIYINQQQTNFPLLARRNILLPLDYYVDRDGIDLTYYPQLGALRDDSSHELLALPYRKDKLHLFYNKDLFDLAEMPYPDEEAMTWDDFVMIAQRMQPKLDQHRPGCQSAIFTRNDWRLIQMFYGKEFDYCHDAPDNIERGLLLLKQMENDRSIPSMAELTMLGSSQRMFETGRYGMFVHGTWYTHYLYADAQDNQIDFRWGMAPCPIWDGEEENNSAWIAPLCIYKDSKHKEEAWRFVQYVTGERGARIMAQEMILPAYSSERIEEILMQRELAENTDLTQMFSTFDAADQMLDADSLVLLSRIGEVFDRAKLGLISREEMLLKIQALRKEVLSK